MSVCVNLVSGMMAYVGMAPMYNATLINDPDPDDLVDSWGFSDNPFYDIGTGLIAFWSFVSMIVQGFPAMLQSYGAPAFIYEPLYWIYRLIWLSAIALGIIAGRQT